MQVHIYTYMSLYMSMKPKLNNWATTRGLQLRSALQLAAGQTDSKCQQGDHAQA